MDLNIQVGHTEKTTLLGLRTFKGKTAAGSAPALPAEKEFAFQEHCEKLKQKFPKLLSTLEIKKLSDSQIFAVVDGHLPSNILAMIAYEFAAIAHAEKLPKGSSFNVPEPELSAALNLIENSIIVSKRDSKPAYFKRFDEAFKGYLFLEFACKLRANSKYQSISADPNFALRLASHAGFPQGITSLIMLLGPHVQMDPDAKATPTSLSAIDRAKRTNTEFVTRLGLLQASAIQKKMLTALDYLQKAKRFQATPSSISTHPEWVRIIGEAIKVGLFSAIYKEQGINLPPLIDESFEQFLGSAYLRVLENGPSTFEKVAFQKALQDELHRAFARHAKTFVETRTPDGTPLVMQGFHGHDVAPTPDTHPAARAIAAMDASTETPVDLLEQEDMLPASVTTPKQASIAFTDKFYELCVKGVEPILSPAYFASGAPESFSYEAERDESPYLKTLKFLLMMLYAGQKYALKEGILTTASPALAQLSEAASTAFADNPGRPGVHFTMYGGQLTSAFNLNPVGATAALQALLLKEPTCSLGVEAFSDRVAGEAGAGVPATATTVHDATAATAAEYPEPDPRGAGAGPL